MSERRNVKTEHAGAKNGGGFWGRRAEAKATSSKVRRERGKDEVRAALAAPPPGSATPAHCRRCDGDGEIAPAPFERAPCPECRAALRDEESAP